MEDHSNFLLDWSCFCRGKSIEELTNSLLITTMELEAARFKALEELKLKEDELAELNQLLTAAINEKNEAQNRYKTLLQFHHRQTTVPPPYSAASSDEHVSDCDDSNVSSSVTDPPVQFTDPVKSPEEEFRVPAKKLPENGKFLEAVVKAGPLLQNLLLAGPLPQWRHPPPPLENYRIPPPPVMVTAPATVNRLLWNVNKKRGFTEGSDCCLESKYQRLSSI